MSAMTAVNSLIEVTPRGPSIAGTRITVYSVMDYIKGNRSKEYILEMMPLITAEQLEAVYDYIEQHREAVEEEYAQILRRSAELQEHYGRIWLERSPFPPGISEEEKHKLMRQRIAEMKAAAQEKNGHHHPA